MASSILTRNHAHSRLGQMRTTAVREVQHGATAVRHGTRDLVATVGGAARRQLYPVGRYIARNPVQSLLIAVGVGVVIGIIRSRFRD